MNNAPGLTWFLLVVFCLGILSGLAGLHATAKLAQWLFSKHRDIWKELGCPGTFFFKGDPENKYLRSISALQGMHRMMPLHSYHRQLADETAQKYLHRHRVARSLSLIFMVLFFLGIIYGLAMRNLPHP